MDIMHGRRSKGHFDIASLRLLWCFAVLDWGFTYTVVSMLCCSPSCLTFLGGSAAMRVESRGEVCLLGGVPAISELARLVSFQRVGCISWRTVSGHCYLVVVNM